MDGLMAMMSPLLAIGAMAYLLKAIGLKDILTPMGMASMATSGASMLTKDGRAEKRVARNLADPWGGRRAAEGLRRANKATRPVTRPTLKMGRAIGRDIGQVRQKHGLPTLREELGTPLAAINQRRVDAGKLPLGQTSVGQLGGRLGNDATRALGKMGVGWFGEDTGAGKVFAPLAARPKMTGSDREHWDAQRNVHNDRKALAAKQLEATTEERHAEITLAHMGALGGSLTATLRPDAEGLEPAMVPLLSPKQLEGEAAKVATELGLRAGDVIADPLTGIALPAPSQTTMMPSEVLSRGAMFETAGLVTNWLDADARRRAPGMTDEEYAVDLLCKGVVAGGFDPVTWQPIDMLAINGLPRNNETLKLLREAADPSKPAPKELADLQISFTPEMHAQVNALKEALNLPERLAERTRQYEPVEASRSVLSQDLPLMLRDTQIKNDLFAVELDRLTPTPGASQARVREALAGVEKLANSMVEELGEKARDSMIVALAARDRIAAGASEDQAQRAAERAVEAAFERMDPMFEQLHTKIYEAKAANGTAQAEKLDELIEFSKQLGNQMVDLAEQDRRAAAAVLEQVSTEKKLLELKTRSEAPRPSDYGPSPD